MLLNQSIKQGLSYLRLQYYSQEGRLMRYSASNGEGGGSPHPPALFFFPYLGNDL